MGRIMTIRVSAKRRARDECTTAVRQETVDHNDECDFIPQQTGHINRKLYTR